MDSIIVSSVSVDGQRGGVFTVQVSGGMQREFSRVFVVKTLDEVATETGEKVVQIASHLEDEVFKTAVGKWVVDGKTFSDSVALTNALEDIVWETIRVVGDEVTDATLNGDEVPKDGNTLRFEHIARTSDIESLEQKISTNEQQISQNTSAINANTQSIANINQNIDDISVELGEVKSQAAVNASDIEGIQQSLAEKEHFRGYYATTSDIQAIAKPNQGDFAYNAQTGTKWAYNGTTWHNTGAAVPDQTVPKATNLPLMDGAAAIGTEEAYAAGDHRHPTDTTRAAQADMTNAQAAIATLQTTVNNIPNTYLPKQNPTLVEGNSINIPARTTGTQAAQGLRLIIGGAQAAAIGFLNSISSGIPTYSYSYIGWGISPNLPENSLRVSNTLLSYKGNDVWHAGNMGTDSGLNADLLDGQHASAFATAAQGALASTAIQGATVGGTAVSINNKILQLPAYPTSLANPGTLTLQLNGTTVATYNGSSAVTANITPASIGAALASHSHTTSQVVGLANVATSGSYNDLINKPDLSKYVLKSGDTMTGALTAPTFIGNLQGNADSATRGNLTQFADANNSVQTAAGVYGYSTSAMINYPADGAGGEGIRIQRAPSNTVSNSQVMLDFFTSIVNNENIYVRKSLGNGTAVGYGTWRKLLHEGNFDSIVGASYVKKAGDTMTGGLNLPTLTITNTAAVPHLSFSRSSLNTIVAPTGGYVGFFMNGGSSLSNSASPLIINATNVYPGATNAYSLGASSYRWSNVYSVNGNFTGTVTAPTFIGALQGNADSASTLSGYSATALWAKDDGFKTLRNFTNGTLIQTSIVAAANTPWLLKIEGNTYGNTNSLYLQAQGYYYNGSYVNTGGFMIGSPLKDLVVFSYNDRVCFWFSSMGYWNGYNIKVYDCLNSAGIGHINNLVTSVTNVAKPLEITREVNLYANIVQYAKATDLSRYVLKAGDTMTGALNVPRLNITGAYLTSAGWLAVIPSAGELVATNSPLIINTAIGVYPGTTNKWKLGDVPNRWSTIYGVNGDFSGTLNMSYNGGANYITTPTWFQFLTAGNTDVTKSPFIIGSNHLRPGTTNLITNGTVDFRWSNVYSVTGDFSGITSVKGLTVTDGAASGGIKMNRDGFNYISTPTTTGAIAFGVGSTGSCSMVIQNTSVIPQNNNAILLGTSANRWSTIYGVNGNFSGSVTATGGFVGNASSATYLQATDLRNVVPSTSGGTGIKLVKAFFYDITNVASGYGRYADLLYLDTYSDSSGGSVNALAFAKGVATSRILHLFGGYNASSWTTAKPLAYLDDNVASATKLQTARTIFGQSFDGTNDVSGNLTGVGSITAAGNITASSFISPYTGGIWLSMATRTNQILGAVPNSASSAHSLFMLKNSSGDAIAYGGLGVNIGFYGFTASRISAGTNGTDWSTTWHVGTGELVHSARLTVRDNILSQNWFTSSGATGWQNNTYGGGIYMSDTTFIRVYGGKRFYVDNQDDATSGNGGSGAAAISTRGGIIASKTIWSGANIYANGAITALATGTSDMRLKKTLRSFSGLSVMQQVGKAFTHQWNAKALTLNPQLSNQYDNHSWSAQKLQEVLPQYVLQGLYGKGYLGINREGLLPIVWNGVLEVNDEVTVLKKKVTDLEKEVERLKLNS